SWILNGRFAGTSRRKGAMLPSLNSIVNSGMSSAQAGAMITAAPAKTTAPRTVKTRYAVTAAVRLSRCNIKSIRTFLSRSRKDEVIVNRKRFEPGAYPGLFVDMPPEMDVFVLARGQDRQR